MRGCSIRLRSEADHDFNCHCRDCQRFAGSACTTAALVPEGDLNISGELSRYPSIGDSGGLVHRFFAQNAVRL